MIDPSWPGWVTPQTHAFVFVQAATLEVATECAARRIG